VSQMNNVTQNGDKQELNLVKSIPKLNNIIEPVEDRKDDDAHKTLNNAAENLVAYPESSDDSEDEIIACQSSPTKSPVKNPTRLSDVLKRKRKLLDDDEEESSSGSGEVRRGFDSSLSDDEIVSLSQSRSEDPPSEPTDDDFQFKEPKLRKKKFIFHPFRVVDGKYEPDGKREPVEVTIPEQLAASYGLYIWPSAPVLAWYIWINQERFRGKRVLELGAGTALPGLLSAKLGCRVTLTDSVTSPHCLDNCRQAVELNSLQESVTVLPLSWGLVTSSYFTLVNCLDFVIGSDLFFDPEVFEPLLVTVRWLLDNNPGCKFLCTVQERSADWSIEVLLQKWGLGCSYEHPETFLRGTGISESDLTGNHTIFIINIFKK